jgi:hypothetical protein
MTMMGVPLFFASCTVSCNAWLFTCSPLAHAKSGSAPVVPTLEDRAAELEATGGDPFFLSDYDDDSLGRPLQEDEDNPASVLSPEFIIAAETVSLSSPHKTFYDIDGFIDPCPKVGGDWKWDGVVDENAHIMDFDDW